MRRVALGVGAATMVATGVALLLPFVAQAPAGLDGYAEWREVALLAIADTSLGAVIVSRRPRHPIGWLFAASGALSALQLLTGEYAGLDPTVAKWVPTAAWIAMQSQFLSVMGVSFVLQLFPTGRVVSLRWRPLPWVTAVGIGLASLAMGLDPGPLDTAPQYDNPVGIAGLSPLLSVVEVTGIALTMAGLAGGLISLGLRLRLADGIERQQVKLLFYAATISVVTLIASNAFFGEEMEQTALGNLVWGGAAVSLSLAITVALLRYRLYEVDRIISRTVTYALVTAVLVAVYAIVAVVPSAVLSFESDLLVAAATLAAAAVFVPVRRRVQAVVDRRFSRARYDAAQVVEGFGARLRQNLDLDRLATDLGTVVSTTVQPTSVSVWVAEPGR